jgi:hypothetical protein
MPYTLMQGFIHPKRNLLHSSPLQLLLYVPHGIGNLDRGAVLRQKMGVVLVRFFNFRSKLLKGPGKTSAVDLDTIFHPEKGGEVVTAANRAYA